MSADAWSFEAEILRHLDSVYRVALWLSGDPTEAHDLTQETDRVRDARHPPGHRWLAALEGAGTMHIRAVSPTDREFELTGETVLARK